MAKRRYEKEATEDQPKVVVLWDSDKCEHCGLCHTNLPSVFNPSARPWVNLDGAPALTIIQQVSECPTQAIAIEEQL
jgi:uncharacterized Fe-S cluster protein YjdI